MEEGRSLLDLIELGQDLEELLQRKVDVLTDGGLSPYLEQRIYAEAVPLGKTTASICCTFETQSSRSWNIRRFEKRSFVLIERLRMP